MLPTLNAAPLLIDPPVLTWSVPPSIFVVPL